MQIKRTIKLINVIKLRWLNKDLYTRNGIGVFFFNEYMLTYQEKYVAAFATDVFKVAKAALVIKGKLDYEEVTYET